jgi:hypothetical protein
MTNPSGVFTSSPSYSYDSELKQCTIRNADTFPAKVFELADDIERLDMSFGHLTSLPDNLGDLKNLKVVNFAHNSFTEIPSVLSSCDKLEVAIFTSCHVNRFDDAAMPASIRGITLTNNELTEIPSSIAAYKKLQKLTLAGNKIKKLPYELLDCPELAMLRLAVNDIDKSPDWLFQHPRLAWYTDSGNHIDKSRDACKQVLRNIPWSDITIAEMVGESSKNTVFRGTLFSGEAVAVKLFGGALSTDGIPEDEMTASLLGSNHAQLIGGLGKVVDGPAGQQGLVMPLVPPEFKNLGLPPSYETLLRDTYPAGTSLSVRYISRVLADIA